MKANKPRHEDGVEAVPVARTMGRYRLCFELASGGMATVYLARAEGPAGFEKLVALKRIHPHLAKETEFVEMFLDEARLASRVNHPNVCSVFDFGEADGTYYIAMEFVLGETVGRLLKALSRDRARMDHPMFPGFVARIIADACEGLHAAHQLKGDKGQPLNVVHRDISPQNLFVAYDGTVRVVDFGIARAVGQLHETRTGTVKGKLAYMSPEQSRKLILDRRADVWALGIVAWELACGKRLFRRETEVDTILAVVSDEVPTPSALHPSIPAGLDLIILKALSRDRDQRYDTARALGRALNRFNATLPEPVTSADLADWMEDLFREDHARRLELIEQARFVDQGPIPRISPHLSSEDSSGLTGQSGMRNVVEGEVPGAAAQSPAEPTERSSKPGMEKLVEKPPTSEGAPDTGPAPPAGSPARAAAHFDEGIATEPWVGERRKHTPGATPVLAQEGVVDRLRAMVPAGRNPLHVGIALVALLCVGLLVTIAVVVPNGEDPENAEVAVADPPEPEPAVAAPDPLLNADPEAELEAAEAPEPVSPVAAEPEVAAEPAPRARRTPRPAPTPRTRRTPPARPQGTGYVDLATPGGWADVYEGRRRIGRTPGRLSLSAGRHVLTLRPFGREAARRVLVDVEPESSRRVVVNLAP